VEGERAEQNEGDPEPIAPEKVRSVARVVYPGGEIFSFPSRKPPMRIHIPNIMALFRGYRSESPSSFLSSVGSPSTSGPSFNPNLPMLLLALLPPFLQFYLPPLPPLQFVSIS
jgi:hypothetical protein